MTLVAVIDTNVVAAGLVTSRADAPTARIIDGMLAARFPYAISEPLLAEYRDVLNRPKLRRHHGLSPDEIESLLVSLAHNAIVLKPVAGPKAPEPGDQHLWDALASHDGLCLVTGDALLQRANNAPAPVLAPASFVAEHKQAG